MFIKIYKNKIFNISLLIFSLLNFAAEAMSAKPPVEETLESLEATHITFKNFKNPTPITIILCPLNNGDDEQELYSKLKGPPENSTPYPLEDPLLLTPGTQIRLKIQTTMDRTQVKVRVPKEQNYKTLYIDLASFPSENPNVNPKASFGL